MEGRGGGREGEGREEGWKRYVKEGRISRKIQRKDGKTEGRKEDDGKEG